MNILEPFELQADVLDRVLSLGVRKSYKRGHLFLDGPSTANLLFFVRKGALRNYFHHADTELTYWISIENQFSCAMNFFMGTSGLTFLEAIEPVEVVELKRDHLHLAYQNDPVMGNFGRLLAEYQLRILERNYLMISEKSAAKRYAMYLELYAYLNGRIHLKHVASLLKIDQATLSRIRNKNNGHKPEHPEVPPETDPANQPVDIEDPPETGPAKQPVYPEEISDPEEDEKPPV